jgi:hypothetical protein
LTDTEVVAHLLAEQRAKGVKPIEAVKTVLGRLRGAFALAIMFKSENDLMVGARNGPPLAIGHGDGQMYLGSDAIALSPFTNKITYIEDGDWVVLTRTSYDIFDVNNKPVKRPMSFSQASSMMVDKGNHRHFMAKEIEEQPEHWLNISTFPRARSGCPSPCRLILPSLIASRSRLAARRAMLVWLRNTGLRKWLAFLSKSMLHRNSATARRRSVKMAWPL